MAGSGWNRNFHVILLAGGSGTRFWPKSRAGNPKQFLALAGKDPLLVAAWKRARKLAPPSRIWVVAPGRLAERICALLPGLKNANMIVEPSPRDTAPAVTLACATVAGRCPDAVVAVLPTDHVIADVGEFVETVRLAKAKADDGALVCLGIRPDRPATGYGYLRCASRPRKGRSTKVDRFVEKPDAVRARRYLKTGRYLWNAGMFVWKASAFMQAVDDASPAIPRSVRRFLEGHPKAWRKAPRISVDYAVMEKAGNVRVVPLEAGWNDLGSWDAVAPLPARRAGMDGKHVMIASKNSAVFGNDRTVAVVGLPGIVVVDTDDAVLVVARKEAERVKDVVDELRKTGQSRLL